MRTRSNLCYGEDPEPMLDTMPPTSSWWKERPPRRNTAPPTPKPPAKRRASTKRRKNSKPIATPEPSGGATLKQVMGPPATPLPRNNEKMPSRRRPSVAARVPMSQPEPAAVQNTPPSYHRMPMRRYSVTPDMMTRDRNRYIAAELHRHKQLDLARSVQQTVQLSTTFEGYRIVQIDHFLSWATLQQFLHRKICPDGLYRHSCEYQSGVHSVFELKCNRCGKTVSCASEEYDHPNPLTIRMVKAMLECPSLDYSEMLHLMNAMEIPLFTEDLYNHLKSEILSYATLDGGRFIKEDIDADFSVPNSSDTNRENLQNVLKETSVTIEKSLSAVAASQDYSNW